MTEQIEQELTPFEKAIQGNPALRRQWSFYQQFTQDGKFIATHSAKSLLTKLLDDPLLSLTKNHMLLFVRKVI